MIQVDIVVVKSLKDPCSLVHQYTPDGRCVDDAEVSPAMRDAANASSI